MARGGKREGAGRKPGSLSVKTREIASAIAEGLTPLEYLTSIYRDEQAIKSERIDAAKAAAPYVHPRLNSIEANVTGDVTVNRVERVIVDPANPNS